MERAILARHGESELSCRGLTNGDPRVACPLTARGREEAGRLGELLATEPIDLCVTSEFERTRETADLALEIDRPAELPGKHGSMDGRGDPLHAPSPPSPPPPHTVA